jgi:hypothetical protein
MAVSDSDFLTYVLGTGDDIEEHRKKYNEKHGYEPNLFFQPILQALVLGPIGFLVYPPVGFVIEADLIYRNAMGLFSSEYYEKDHPGLVGKVREYYKACKS